MNIPMLDLKSEYALLREELEPAMLEAMAACQYIGGPNVKAFEQEAAAYAGVRHAIACASGTDALLLALRAGGIGPGDEVITTPFTFVATASTIIHAGGTPVFADVRDADANIDPEAIERAITPRTRAIVPVHFAGEPCDMDAINDLARRHSLRVLEDAAHAIGTMYRGRMVGTLSDAAAFSFYATKTMTSGEGGMIVSADPDLVTRMRTMRLHGISRDVFNRYTSTAPSWHYEVVAPGFKYNLTDVAASMARVQLGRALAMRERRTAIAAHYDEHLAGLPVRLPSRPTDSGTEHAWHLYVLRLTDDAPMGRDEFIQRMSDAGVGCSVHFIPLHHHPYWRDLRGPQSPALPVADAQFERAVSIPIFSSMTDAQVARVAQAVRTVLGGDA